MSAMPTYNQPGHVCPETGRRAMTVADAHARRYSDMWLYLSESAKVAGLEAWRRIESVDLDWHWHANATDGSDRYTVVLANAGPRVDREFKDRHTDTVRLQQANPGLIVYVAT